MYYLYSKHICYKEIIFKYPYWVYVRIKMNLIVLIKQVPDPENNAGMKEDGSLNREKSQNIINPYDKNALEAALSMKEKYGGKVIALSMGLPGAKDVLKEAIAIGADEVYLINDKKLALSDTLATAYTLSKAVKKIGAYDIILCGMQAIDGDTSHVGPQVAERLGIPQVTYVDKIVSIENKIIEARKIIEGGYEIITTEYPALLTITNTANQPRLPSLKGKIKASKYEVPVWAADFIEADENKIGENGSPTKVKEMYKSTTEKVNKLFEEKPVEQMVTELLCTLKGDCVPIKEN